MKTTKNYKGISVTFNSEEDKKRSNVIYKLTFPNGKCYIGQTKQELQTRISSHCYNSMSEKSPDYSTHKSRAIRKYQSFTVEVLGNCDNTLELDNLEIQMINIFDSVENGYNTQKGGSNSFDNLTPKEFEIFKNVVSEYHNNISLEARKLIRLNRPYNSYYIEYLDQINTDFNLEDFFKSNIFVIKKKPSNIISFAELVKSMEKRKFELGYYDMIYKRYPFLEEAIQKLGFERIKELRYSITKIKEELLKLKGVSLETKIFTLLKSNNKISDGIFISSSDLKNIFNKVYNTLNVKKTAKATDILCYYEVKECTKKISGKSVKGYIIIKPKILIK